MLRTRFSLFLISTTWIASSLACADMDARSLRGLFINYPSTEYENVIVECATGLVWRVSANDTLAKIQEYYESAQKSEYGELLVQLRGQFVEYDADQYPNSHEVGEFIAMDIVLITPGAHAAEECRGQSQLESQTQGKTQAEIENAPYVNAKQTAKIQVLVESDQVLVFVQNTGNKKLTIIGNFEVGGRHRASPTYLELKDDQGELHRVTAIIDGAVLPEKVLVPIGHLYGRAFPIKSLIEYFQVPRGRYEVRAVYEWPEQSTSTDSETILRIESSWVPVTLE